MSAIRCHRKINQNFLFYLFLYLNPIMDEDPPLSWSYKIFHRLLPLIFNQRSNLRNCLQHLVRKQLLTADEMRIIEGGFRVTSLRVRDIMVPSGQIVMIDATTPPEVFLSQIIQSKHSRFPVFDPKQDRVIGMLLAKDLLPGLMNNSSKNWNIHESLREVTFVPESKSLNLMLEDFRRKRNHMAVVLNEFNNIAGLITIEDVLEQIVGEIEDEHDHRISSHRYITYVPGKRRTYLVQGEMPLESFNAFFSSHFDHRHVDTIGGILLQHFQYLPAIGETLLLGDWYFTVTEASKRRIMKVQIEPAKKSGRDKHEGEHG